MRSARIKEISEIVIDGTHGSPVRTGSGVPVLSAQNVKNGVLSFETDRYTSTEEYEKFSSRLSLRKGDLLLTIVGTIGRAAIVTEVRPAVFQRSVAVIRPRMGVVDSRFFFHVTQAQEFQSQLTRSANQSSQAGVYLGKLNEIEIPLLPLSDQLRIADVLDRAEALRARRRAALAQLDQLAKDVFIDLFGDPATNVKKWPEKFIADLCEVKGGKRLPKGEEYSLTPTPFRYIRVTDMRDGRVDESNLVYLKPEVRARISRYIVSAGDIVISIAGSIGVIATVPASIDGANLTENAAKLVPRASGLYDANYLAALLKTPYAQAQISSHIGQVTIGKLALFRIEKLRVPVPPLLLQHEFVRRVAAVEKLKMAHRASLAELDALFASLQHRAFRGEL